MMDMDTVNNAVTRPQSCACEFWFGDSNVKTTPLARFIVGSMEVDDDHGHQSPERDVTRLLFLFPHVIFLSKSFEKRILLFRSIK